MSLDFFCPIPSILSIFCGTWLEIGLQGMKIKNVKIWGTTFFLKKKNHIQLSRKFIVNSSHTNLNFPAIYQYVYYTESGSSSSAIL